MRYILGLDLHNVVTIKQASVDFNHNLTYVRGSNLDSDAANPTGNGAGKTLLFSTLANVLFQTTPLALKKKSRRDILRQRGSSVGIILKEHVEGPEYEIIQTSKGYTIYEDGKDLELHTIPRAEAYIRKLFPLSDIKFYSTCYLSTQRPYLIQRDTDTNRLQHFTDIFNLDQYTAIKDVLTQRLRTIKDNELKLSVLQQQRLGLRKKLKDLRAGASREEYAQARSEYTASTSDMDKLQAEKFTLTTQKRDLDALLVIEKTLDVLRGQYSFKKPPAKMLKFFRQQRSDSISWDRWRQRSAQSTKMLAKLDAQLEALDLPNTPKAKLSTLRKKTIARIRELDSLISDQRSAERKFVASKKEIARLTSEYEELGITTTASDVDYDSEIAVLNSTIKLEKLLKHEHESQACPTCLAPLDFDNLRGLVARAKKRKEKLLVLSKASRLLTQIAELSEGQVEFDQASYDDLVTEQDLLNKKRDTYELGLDTYSKHETLCSHRSEIEIPNKPDGDEPEQSVTDIDGYIDLCVSIADALSSKDVLLSNHSDLSDLRSAEKVLNKVESIARRMSDIDAKLSKLRLRQSSAASVVSAYEQHKNTHGVYKKELDEVDLKIEKLTPSATTKKLLDILIKAYGPKGLRAQAADSVCSLFQTNLNHYSDLIFAEPFIFEVKASESGISILVDRNNGKPDSISDVRNLSGAESNSFQLLCLISLLPLIPDNERVNLVILDEPTSHQDAVSREIFHTRFIPVLREVVPSVYVIDNHGDPLPKDAKEWVVQKQGGTSTLLT